MNVVTAAQVEKLNLRSFQEIASIVPGLTMTQTSSFSSQATVRGVAFVPEASGNNPSVEFYLNDAPISSGFLFQSTYDFGQFELQRGPQGTLRGRAAPSGSIAVTTRRPDLNEIGLVANGTVTNLDAYKVDGALNIPIINDVLALRLNPSEIAGQRAKLEAELKSRGLSTKIPSFITELGIYPGPSFDNPNDARPDYPRRMRAALRLARAAHWLEPAFSRLQATRSLGAMLRLAPKRVHAPAPSIHAPAATNRRGRVVLTQGCVEAVLRPEIRAAAVRLLARAGFDVDFAVGEGCCGGVHVLPQGLM